MLHWWVSCNWCCALLCFSYSGPLHIFIPELAACLNLHFLSSFFRAPTYAAITQLQLKSIDCSWLLHLLKFHAQLEEATIDHAINCREVHVGQKHMTRCCEFPFILSFTLSFRTFIVDPLALVCFLLSSPRTWQSQLLSWPTCIEITTSVFWNVVSIASASFYTREILEIICYIVISEAQELNALIYWVFSWSWRHLIPAKWQAFSWQFRTLIWE